MKMDIMVYASVIAQFWLKIEQYVSFSNFADLFLESLGAKIKTKSKTKQKYEWLINYI